MFRTSITKEQAWQKIKHYCAYQERCHQEVKEKLYGMGVWKRDVEELISKLIEEDYLNEERFALQFAGGKFRMKKWGKVKIEYELKQKRVSAYCVNKALKSISAEDYEQTLTRLYQDKSDLLEKEDPLSKKRKLTDYLIRKGYERSRVMELIHSKK